VKVILEGLVPAFIHRIPARLGACRRSHLGFVLVDLPEVVNYSELSFVGNIKLENGKLSDICFEGDNVYALNQLVDFSQPYQG
jgi:hypothetical protein